MHAKKSRTSKNTKSPQSKPAKPGQTRTEAGERLRKAAIADIQARLDGKAPVKPSASDGKAAPGKQSSAKPRRMSALDAAAKVLTDSRKPARVKDLIDAMTSKGLWSSPGGKTPQATLFAAISREIATKGKQSRFRKAERGLFAAAGGA